MMRKQLATLGSLLALLSCSDATNGVDAAASVKFASPRLIGSAEDVHDIRDIALDSSGSIWVLSSFDPHLFVFSADGELSGNFGERGPGPGELGNPVRFVGRRIAQNVARIWDASKRRVQRFSATGEYEGGLTVPLEAGMILGNIAEQTYVDPGRLVPLGTAYVRDVYSGQVSQPAHLWRGALVKIGADGVAGDTLIHFSDLTDMPPQSDGPSFASVPLWSSCRGRIAVLNPVREEVLWLDSTGTITDTVKLDLPETRITDADRSRFVRHQLADEVRDQALDPNAPQVDRMVEQILASGEIEFAEYAPPVNLLCGAAGELWIQLFSTEHDAGGYGRRWIRMSEGVQETIEIPVGFTPVIITDDQAIGIQTDQFGVEAVAVSAIERGG